MRTLDADFIIEKNKEENKPIFLYTIFDYDGNGNNLCNNSWDETLTFDGVVYTDAVIVHEDIGMNSEGSVDAVMLRIGNVNRVMQSYLENIDYHRKKVSIKRIFYDKLSEALAQYQDVYFIDEYEATEQEITFTLTSAFDLMGVTLPARIMSRNFCQWKFKSAECAYAGAETQCNKTLARCRVLSNQLRYGGFPGIPSMRILK